jgi:ubiquinone/menaquinone biosynthesis C-methylase UbiE
MNYQEGAMRFYDLFGEKDDVEFYVEQAKKHGLTALELGVGTARLAIHLAQAGIETWGLEASSYMLKAAEKNIEKEDIDVQNRLRLIHGNAEDFSLNQKFDLIYFPSCSFDHILEPENQMKALRNFARHLKPNGSFIFDLYLVNDLRKEPGWFVQKKQMTSNQVVVRSGYHRIDPEKRILLLDMWYELVENGRITERYYETSQVYIHCPEEVRKMLDATGFKIVEEYSDHHGKSFNEGDEIIVFVTNLKK